MSVLVRCFVWLARFFLRQSEVKSSELRYCNKHGEGSKVSRRQLDGGMVERWIYRGDGTPLSTLLSTSMLSFSPWKE